ncbi:caspase family protein [Micromonospora sp. NPDC049903]|uniref:caspase, EACC1-associated type n=1 Tax=Micromonospora sp. NPDC049903 TaxID=3364276 RepID=UPI00378D9255
MTARRALLVACAEYADPRLRRLRSPVHDVDELAAVLADPRIGAYEVEPPLINRSDAEVRRAVSRFLRTASRSDTLLLHFACHGYKDDGQLHLAARDTDLDDLMVSALPADLLSRLINRSPSRRKILILDCCFSGAVSRTMIHRGVDDHTVNIAGLFGDDDGQGLGIITASQAEEYALDSSAEPVALTAEVAHSVFAAALIEGLRSGGADLDGDGRVSFDDLYQYVYRRVVAAGVPQTPGQWNWVRGSLIVAHRPPTVPPEQEPTGSGVPTRADCRSPWDAALLDWRFAVTPAVDRLLSVQARTSAERYGWGLLRNGEWAVAQVRFAEAVRHSGGGSAWWGRAVCHAAEEQWGDAGEAFERAADRLAAGLGSRDQGTGSPSTVDSAGLCAAAALLGAVTFAAAGSPRADDLLVTGLNRVPFCPQLLAYRGLLHQERAPLSLALRLDPGIVDDFAAVGLDIEQAVLDAASELDRRLDTLARERDRLAALARTVPTAWEEPPTAQSPPRTATPRERLDAGHRRVHTERESLTAWARRLRMDALALLMGTETVASPESTMRETLMIEVIRSAVLAVEALQRTELPPPVTALGVPPRLAR